jgi:hypothetical protein
MRLELLWGCTYQNMRQNVSDVSFRASFISRRCLDILLRHVHWPRYGFQHQLTTRFTSQLVTAYLWLQFILSCERWRVIVDFLLEPFDHPLGSEARIESIRIAHERFHLLVTHQVNNARVDLVQFSRVNGKYLVFNGSDVRIAVLHSGALSRLGCGVLTSAMYEGGNKLRKSIVYEHNQYQVSVR